MSNIITSTFMTPTRILIDFQDCLCNTDFYVIKKIFNETKNKNSDHHYRYLHYIYDEFNGEPDDYIIERINFIKSNNNILYNFLDKSKIKPCDYNTILKKLYNIYLYKDKDHLIANAYWTLLAKGLKLLLKDKNLEKLLIYTGEKNDFNPIICEVITNFFNNSNNKIEVIAGPKSILLQKYKFDVYILNNISDINNLLYERTQNIDVYILGQERNVVSVTKELGVKKLSLPKSPDVLLNDYKMIINMINLPI